MSTDRAAQRGAPPRQQWLIRLLRSCPRERRGTPRHRRTERIYSCWMSGGGRDPRRARRSGREQRATACVVGVHASTKGGGEYHLVNVSDGVVRPVCSSAPDVSLERSVTVRGGWPVEALGVSRFGCSGTNPCRRLVQMCSLPSAPLAISSWRPSPSRSDAAIVRSALELRTTAMLCDFESQTRRSDDSRCSSARSCRPSPSKSATTVKPDAKTVCGPNSRPNHTSQAARGKARATACIGIQRNCSPLIRRAGRFYGLDGPA